MSENETNSPKPNLPAMTDKPRRVSLLRGQKKPDSTAPLGKPLHWYATKRGKIIIAVIAILIIGGAIGAVLYTRRGKPVASSSPSPAASATPTPTPSKKASPLTGVEVDPPLAEKPIIASIVENLVNEARPQSGLSTAGVVYEALAEGGITRYLALWQADTPADIGPVRSVRPVFYNFAMEYSAPTAHAGGSSDGLALARGNTGFKDLDQFYFGNSYFRRITSRYAPHNLYITGENLTKLAASKGWGGAPTFTPWERKDDQAVSPATATTITADFSYADYRAIFRYDATSNSYRREIGGKPDLDAANSKNQISPKTVIIIYASTVGGTQANGKPKTDIDVIGSGSGIVFQDGAQTAITWSKPSATARMSFKDSAGATIKLNRGQSWVSVVPSSKPVSVQ